MAKYAASLFTSACLAFAPLALVCAPAAAEEARPSVQDWVKALQPPMRTRSLAPGQVAPPPAQKSTSLIRFEFNSDRLTPLGKSISDDVATALKAPELAGVRFRIEGHTDAKGGEEYNQQLSERRAAAVRDYLVRTHGIEPDRVVAAGKGKRELYRPDAPMADENRRVSFVELISAN
jgi:outer membrane protein OmpA-like peptidoglycan-associated protein